MISINTKDELSLYYLEGKWNEIIKTAELQKNDVSNYHVDEKEKSSKLLDPSQKIELKEI